MSQSKPRILISESGGFSTRAAARLRQAGEVVLADLDRNDLLFAVRDVDVLWVRLRHQIDGEVLSSAPRLKIIATPATGLNHIDLEEAGRRGIQVLSLRGERDFLRDVRATAEHTMALILSLLRRVPGALAHVLDGGWNRDLFRGSELYGKAVGIVGYGRLGRAVARYLKAFDATVLASDPNVKTSNNSGVTLLPLMGLLREADLVSLHVDLNPATCSFFGREQFSVMKQGSWFVNTSRGELIDERSLLDALQSGRLAGAALDVLCGERSEGMADHPIVAYAREHDNLIVTPHIGGCTTESMEKTELFLAEKLCSGSLLPLSKNERLSLT
jgi:D-3-phosphoglycerate dehydrogenase